MMIPQGWTSTDPWLQTLHRDYRVMWGYIGIMENNMETTVMGWVTTGQGKEDSMGIVCVHLSGHHPVNQA